MKLSLSLLVFARYELEEAIERTARMGYDGVEIPCWRPHAYPGDLSPNLARRLKRRMDGLGVEASALSAQGTYDFHNLSATHSRLRRDSVQYVKRCIELASKMGSNTVTILPGRRLYGIPLDRAWKSLVSSCRECAEIAEDCDIDVVIHHVKRSESNVLCMAEEAMRLLREVKMKNFKGMFEPYHTLVMGESIVDSIKMLGDRLGYVHLSDTDGRHVARLPLGKGVVNFEVVFSTLKEVGYDGYVSAELPQFQNPEIAALESKRYVQQFLT